MNNYDNSYLNEEHGESQFKPNTTVAAVVHYQGHFLFVEEKENDLMVLNQPAGHLEKNESIITAVQRELHEETGLKLKPNNLSGIYYFHRPEVNLYFLRFCFVFEVNSCLNTFPQDDEILGCHWLTLEELKKQISVSHKNGNNRLRSPMVLTCIEDYIAGQRIPLSALKSNL